MYTDTGGGLFSIFPNAARRLRIGIDTIGQGGGQRLFAQIPRALGDPQFPRIPVGDSAAVTLIVEAGPPPEDEAGITWDGRLGSLWFANGVWTLDYPHRKLYFNDAAPTGPSAASCWVPLGFQTDSLGKRIGQFPRIAALIAGDTVQFLLDTGARTTLTTKTWDQIGHSEPRHRAASFISQERFEDWHHAHPDWPVIRKAEEGADSSAMIRVPKVQVGQQTIGPVWFTERPTRSFRVFMSDNMDRPVDGALGGSALKYTSIVIDYPRARAALYH